MVGEFPWSIWFQMEAETFTSSSEVRGMDKRQPENQREKRFPIFRSTERNLPAD